jgi:hypothetical protein
LGVDHGSLVIGNVGAIEELAQGFAEHRFGNPVFLDKEIFQVDALLKRILDGLYKISLTDEALIDQQVKGARIDRSADYLLHLIVQL